MNLISAINKANQKLKKQGITSSRLDCEILMSAVIGKEKEDIILNPNEFISETKMKIFDDLIDERAKKKPVAYLTGIKEFWKYQFYVTKDVLIPRPETEIIIEQALILTKNKKNLIFLDIGVGSGCIILSLLKEKANFLGTGIDVSKESLRICKINSDKLGVSNRIKLFKSDIDNFNFGKYDLIVSNPPYINNFELKCLDDDVIGYEPIKALDGGVEGLSQIKKVIRKSSKLIKKNGTLILEIGFGQKNKVLSLLKDNEFYINGIIKDLSNKDRCIISTKI